LHSEPDKQEISADELTLSDLLRLLLHRRRIIVLTSLSFLILGGLYSCLHTRRFEAVAFLTISPEGSNTVELSDSISNIDNRGLGFDEQLETQARILQSDSLAWAVITDMNLVNRPGFRQDHRFSIIGSHWPSQTNAEAQITPKKRNRLLQQFKNALVVRTVPRTQALEIRFRSEDPSLAAGIPNRLAFAYTTRAFRTRFDDTLKASDWLSRELARLKTSVDESQSKLSKFQKTTGIFGADANNNLVLSRLDDLSKELTDAEANRILKEAQFRLAQSGNPELIGTIVPDSVLPVLRTQQADLQNQLAQASSEFGPQYPKVLQLQSQLAQVNKELEKETAEILERFRTEYGISKDAEQLVRKTFDQQKQLAGDMSGGLDQYGILKREVESGNDLYQDLQKKMKEAGVVASLRAPAVDVIDPATVPTDPVEPKAGLVLLLSLGLGLALGFVIALVAMMLDPTIQTSHEVFALTSLPILSIVPCLPSRWAPLVKRMWSALLFPKPTDERNLDARSFPEILEAFRAMSTMISDLDSKSSSMVTLITSTVHHEGKTFTSVCLAESLSQQGARVLLVDADLKLGSLSRLFGLESSPGLRAVFSQSLTWRDAVARAPRDPRLHILPSGTTLGDSEPKNKKRHLSSLVDEWRAEYDHVIFDSAPTLLAAEPVRIARWADNIVLVSRLGITPRRGLQRAHQLLFAANKSILGCVMNAMSRTDMYLDFGYKSEDLHMASMASSIDSNVLPTSENPS
jgi:polysaccharide biosynthesis transport protein